MTGNQTRDPFAPPGYPGNRSIQYGKDGSIPGPHRNAVEKAIPLAYSLAFNPAFRKTFNDTVSKLAGKSISKHAYFEALEKMILHYAETSKHPLAVKELKEDAIARAREKSYRSPPAFSMINGRDVWLRSFLLKKGDPKLIAGAIMHESAHLAGAPGDLLAEMALERLGEISGYKRK